MSKKTINVEDVLKVEIYIKPTIKVKTEGISADEKIDIDSENIPKRLNEIIYNSKENEHKEYMILYSNMIESIKNLDFTLNEYIKIMDIFKYSATTPGMHLINKPLELIKDNINFIVRNTQINEYKDAYVSFGIFREFVIINLNNIRKNNIKFDENLQKFFYFEKFFSDLYKNKLNPLNNVFFDIPNSENYIDLHNKNYFIVGEKYHKAIQEEKIYLEQLIQKGEFIKNNIFNIDEVLDYILQIKNELISNEVKSQLIMV